MSGLAAGSWTVSAHLGTHVSEPGAAGQLSPGGRAELDLVLHPGAVLCVIVEDASGKHIGAELSVRDERDREHGELRTRRGEKSAEGTTFIGPLAPGTYRVTASKDGETATQSVTIHGPADFDVRLRLGL